MDAGLIGAIVVLLAIALAIGLAGAAIGMLVARPVDRWTAGDEEDRDGDDGPAA